MNTLLKLLLIAIFGTILVLGNTQVVTAEPETFSGEVEPVVAQDIVPNEQHTIYGVALVAIIDGVSKKFANCDLSYGLMSKSIGEIQSVGTDIDKYELAHRGIVLKDCKIKIRDIAEKIIQRLDANGSDYIIPYRYIRSNFEYEGDKFLGHALTSYYKSGEDISDFGCDIALCFGNCKSACGRGGDFGTRYRVDETLVKNVRSAILVLADEHKRFLLDIISRATEAAQHYDTYNTLYHATLSETNFAKQADKLQAELDEKKIECERLESAFDSASNACDSQQEELNANNAEIIRLQGLLTELNAERDALEDEQINLTNLNRDNESRHKSQEECSEVIIAACKSLELIDPMIFDGEDCCNAKNVMRCYEKIKHN